MMHQRETPDSKLDRVEQDSNNPDRQFFKKYQPNSTELGIVSVLGSCCAASNCYLLFVSVYSLFDF
jgi:hypothetical protein